MSDSPTRTSGAPRPELTFPDPEARQAAYALLEEQAAAQHAPPVVLPAHQLHGPATGTVDLPGTLGGLLGHTDPHQPYDLTAPRAMRRLYEVVLTYGSAEDTATLIHPEELVRLWPSLVLPAAVREAWAAEWRRDGGGLS